MAPVACRFWLSTGPTRDGTGNWPEVLNATNSFSSVVETLNSRFAPLRVEAILVTAVWLVTSHTTVSSEALLILKSVVLPTPCDSLSLNKSCEPESWRLLLTFIVIKSSQPVAVLFVFNNITDTFKSVLSSIK